MYWVTTRPCLECGVLVFPRSENYTNLKDKITQELKTDPSNPWPDVAEPGTLFGIGLVKVYISKKKHEFFDYYMRCFSCGFQIGKEEYEKELETFEAKRKHRLIKYKGHGIWSNKKQVVPPLEDFSF